MRFAKKMKADSNVKRVLGYQGECVFDKTKQDGVQKTYGWFALESVGFGVCQFYWEMGWWEVINGV